MMLQMSLCTFPLTIWSVAPTSRERWCTAQHAYEVNIGFGITSGLNASVERNVNLYNLYIVTAVHVYIHLCSESFMFRFRFQDMDNMVYLLYYGGVVAVLR